MTKKSSITYLNSGDWVENLTALEYFDKQWSIYHYNKAEFPAGLKQIQKEIKSDTKIETTAFSGACIYTYASTQLLYPDLYIFYSITVV